MLNHKGGADAVEWVTATRVQTYDRNQFRRQVPIGPFIADFCCPERRVVIELDGEGHREAQQVAYDSERDAYLRGLDYIVLRFPNQKVLEDLDSVIQEIATTILKSPPSWRRSQTL